MRRLRPIRCLPVFAIFLSAFALPTIARAEMQFSIYGGAQTAPHSKIRLSDGSSFTAGWEGKSFTAPQYYGARATWWLDEFQKPNLGLSIDFTHAKVYADGDTLRNKSPGWSHFEFSDGLNLVTANALYRFQKEGRAWTPYIGAGVGINVPHVEVTRPQGKTFEYAYGGVTLQAQAGISYQFTERWSAFAEYKGNYSFVDVSIDSGDSLKTKVMTNAVNLGVSFHW
ncbi:outer membrane beta-barrel protein [Rhizobium sp. LjRoot30]|uniref:outer membrane protein n=1 Tax=Rhizobium sp. LjRoot30 TaxID=3342320 RepID=UPI003ED08CF6